MFYVNLSQLPTQKWYVWLRIQSSKSSTAVLSFLFSNRSECRRLPFSRSTLLTHSLSRSPRFSRLCWRRSRKVTASYVVIFPKISYRHTRHGVTVRDYSHETLRLLIAYLLRCLAAWAYMDPSRVSLSKVIYYSLLYKNIKWKISEWRGVGACMLYMTRRSWDITWD